MPVLLTDLYDCPDERHSGGTIARGATTTTRYGSTLSVHQLRSGCSRQLTQMSLREVSPVDATSSSATHPSLRSHGQQNSIVCFTKTCAMTLRSWRWRQGVKDQYRSLHQHSRYSPSGMKSEATHWIASSSPLKPERTHTFSEWQDCLASMTEATSLAVVMSALQSVSSKE